MRHAVLRSGAFTRLACASRASARFCVSRDVLNGRLAGLRTSCHAHHSCHGLPWADWKRSRPAWGEQRRLPGSRDPRRARARGTIVTRGSAASDAPRSRRRVVCYGNAACADSRTGARRPCAVLRELLKGQISCGQHMREYSSVEAPEHGSQCPTTGVDAIFEESPRAPFRLGVIGAQSQAPCHLMHLQRVWSQKVPTTATSSIRRGCAPCDLKIYRVPRLWRTRGVASGRRAFA